MFVEPLEARTFFAADTSVYLTRPPTRASENGPTIRGFRVWRTGDTSAPLTVHFQIGGTATNSVDYGIIGTAITVPAGVGMMQVKVRPFDDSKIENVETVTMTLLPDAGYEFGITPSSTIRITDNDASVPPLPSVSVTAPGTNALETGPVSRLFTVSRDGSTSDPLTVNFVIGGSATNGVDYAAIGTQVTIPSGASNVTVALNPVDDSVVEANESVTLTLTPDAVYTVGSSSAATLQISDNDVATGVLSWTSLPSVPLGRSEAMRASANGKLFVFGGYIDVSTIPTPQVHRYDPATNAWTRMADMPVGLTHSGVAVDGQFVYIAGGYPANANRTAQIYATTTVRKYDSSSDTWSTIRPLPSARGGGAMVRLGRELHFFSGSDLSRQDRGEHWSLNLDDANAQWIARASLPTPRNHLGGEELNGKIYAIGGAKNQDEAETAMATVEIWDPLSDAWSTGPSLPTPRALVMSGVTVRNGRIIVAGGETAFNTGTAQVTSFDPQTNSWSQLTALPGKRISGLLALLGDELVYTTGYNNGFTATAWLGTFA